MKILLSVIALTFIIKSSYAQGFNLVGDAPQVTAPQSESEVRGGDEDSPLFELASSSPVTQPSTAEEINKYEIPPTEIGGADSTYPLGDMVQLWIKPIPQKPEFLESVTYSWTILPGKKAIVWPDSTRILFGTGVQNGKFTVILTASYVYVEPTEDGASIIAQRAVTRLIEVKVGTGETAPNPGNPLIPDPGLAGLSKSAYDWTAFVEVGPDYSTEKMKRDAAVLANNFAQIAKEIEDNKLLDIGDILTKTKTLNDNGTVSRNNWLPWFAKMSEFLSTGYNNGTVQTPEQFANVWKQISQGLAAASQ